MAKVLFVACSGQQFHSNRVAGGDVAVQERVHAGADRAARVSEELDPGRGVDEDHRARLPRISSRSASHPEPRKRRACSTLSGSPATERSAKLTASRLVLRLYRFITAPQASSSMSMFVRAIHPPYTSSAITDPFLRVRAPRRERGVAIF